ncbi:MULTISPECIES: aminotransferase class III-fold pyridoxal phosphate-dependent enzyme [unclassified Pseudomonas]|uniref:aminotransferase class III-fold pyridoxal phosphate-dependent enzyme n=1 Tax=unclassified Pseudomonas TaxID=196821 RepID=UPI002B223361|nr:MULTISPECIES: aminotransferase class III-fold pyridoxal phosphate-dependent enzyme [unclassified Pseudomonas]MEA9979787.1 aminotransferase class III-fold pyridoxal phosphate-dependent enzyme [Pseudomonas sp. RTS4]MEB0199996.1 aminotransferase class III-fold pyridoxal phosphate-dependent enzyme [Pseudomonas sp. 5S4]MEB0248428.1 aminotransferase class III-fold pyridoxal phosphate-dependent enzyme [Pseudomonas sp. 10S5]
MRYEIISGNYETYMDGDSRRIIDLSGGFGYQVPQVIDAVALQAQQMGLSNRVLMSEPLIRLCRKLAEILPDPLVSSYVCNSGDEAFEGALKLCKGLHPRRNTIVYIKGGDYGSLTYGRCLNQPQEYEEVQRFLGFRSIAIGSLEDLNNVDWRDCFAVCHANIGIGTDGNQRLISHDLIDFLYSLAAREHIPVIGVDVQSCLGSLGTLFGFQQYSHVPSIVVLGGALGGGALPIGTYTCSENIAYKVYGRSSPAKHGSTTAGNPMACVAAIAALDHVISIDAPVRCEENGRILGDVLEDFDLRVHGGWVGMSLDEKCDVLLLQKELYSRGVYVNVPTGRELILRIPITARSEQIARAATAIKETYSHVLNHAA